MAPIGAILRLPTPSPTPAGTPVVVNGNTVSACNSWLYLLHWDGPSRLAQLKNALGDTVNINSEFYPPGSNILDNTTTPWTIERASGLAVGGPPDGSAWDASAPNWQNWAGDLGTGATAEYHQGSDLVTYLSATVPALMSGSTATLFIPSAQPTLTQVGPNVGATYNLPAYDPAGNQVTWSWTIDFGSDSNGLVYKPDPGRPFKAYDETLYDGSNYPPTPDPLSFLGSHTMDVGSSIPGITGTPVGNAASFVRYEAARQIVSQTADTVNWGLLSFSDVSGDADVTTACAYSGNYQLAQDVSPYDDAKIAQVEAALNMVYYGGIYSRGGTPSKMALKTAGADLYGNTYKTDPKIAFCDRPYGLIFCTDGASNICNPSGSDTDWTGPPAIPPCDCTQTPPQPPTGYSTCAGCADNPGPYQYNGPSMDYPSAGEPWTNPCEGFYGFDAGCYTPVTAPDGTTRVLRCCDAYSRLGGSGYDCNVDELSSNAAQINHFKNAPVPGSWQNVDPGFVAGVAESLFINGFADAGKRKVNVRTFVIGLSTTVGKCELNYTAFRGRTDASAKKGDAGYAYVTDAGLGDPGDPRLLQPAEDETVALKYQLNTVTNPSGDYAFFATDPQSIYDSFQRIIAGTAIGDYATSPPVSGSAVSLANIVLIPSTDYPGWLGRLRAIDTLKSGPAAILWDAGDLLSKRDPAERKIYTWDPADLAGGLIELTVGNIGAVQSIVGVPASFNKNVIDFLRGNDGTLKNIPRGWVFGASINSTPAVIGKPEIYTGGAYGHAAFEVQYKSRKPVAWVGADDGMLHAFNFNTGQEILALMPPELLAQQVTLFKNYKTILNPNKDHETLTGQNPDILKHIWGVANSFRFADIYDGTNWKTVGYLALGPAGKTVTAIDVTHPSLGDPYYDPTKDPVKILWRKTSTDLPQLGQAWSVPAISIVKASPLKFLSLFGSGFDTSSTATNKNGTSQRNASLFQLDALNGNDGSASGNHVTLTRAALDPANRFLVGQQAFAASTLFQTTAPTYYGSNISNLGIQADLNGRIWFNFASSGTNFDQIQLGIDAPKAVQNIEGTADQAPLYYPVASSGVGTSGCALYSFGSGTSYEKSPLVSLPDGSAHPTGTNQSDYSWSPRLFLAVNTKANTTGEVTVAGPGEAIYETPISSLLVPPCDSVNDPGGPGCKLGSTDPLTLGPKTQMTAPPFLLVPLSGTGEFQALYLLYDPEAIGYCRGYSYIVVLSISLTGCSKVTVTKTEVFGAGEGAASGFALAGTKVVVGKSGVGAGQQAGVVQTPINILQYGSFGNVTPVYWKELQ